MSYRSGEPARLSVEIHDDHLLPLEVRDHKLRLVANGLNLRDIELPAGTYVVSAKLPGHEELLETVHLESGEHRLVELTPQPNLLLPRARYNEGFATTERDERPSPPTGPPQPSVRGPVDWQGPTPWTRSPWTWSARFFASGAGFQLQPLSWRPEVAVREDDPDRTVLEITVSEPAVVFAQIAFPGEVPLNVALPAAGVQASATCVLTIQAKAGHLFLGALPAGSRVASRAAEYLASEQVLHGRAVIDTREAEDLLRGKLIDPMSAAVGGYLLLRTNELDHLHDWPERLASLLPWFPDGAVIAGETAAMRGETSQAVKHFLDVTNRGLPIFTDGYSMLIARARQYQSNTKLRSAIDPADREGIERFLARLMEWNPFIDFSAPTLTFRAADPGDPGASQEPFDAGSPTRPPTHSD